MNQLDLSQIIWLPPNILESDVAPILILESEVNPIDFIFSVYRNWYPSCSFFQKKWGELFSVSTLPLPTLSPTIPPSRNTTFSKAHPFFQKMVLGGNSGENGTSEEVGDFCSLLL